MLGYNDLTEVGTVDHAAVDMATRSRRVEEEHPYPHTMRAADDEELYEQWERDAYDDDFRMPADG